METKNYRNTTVNSYFSWLEKTIDPDTELYKAVHSYLDSERNLFAESRSEDELFLSIVMRTQGRRPEMLAEVLLCLTAQSNTNFEVLLMGHNLAPEQHACVTQLISELPEWMQKKTNLHPVTGGTRTTPLNAGFKKAQGRYIAVLDDDDLVMDNWVEEFYQLSQEHDGEILHTYAVMQEWETVGGEHPETPRACGSPNPIYCKDFNFMEELSINHCPLCTLAFPAYAFKKLGIRFDETLTTTEDWDYLMRTSFLTGVANSPVITFIYRRWVNTESSATIHKQEEWDRNYSKIVNRFVRTPIIMPSGSLHGTIDRYVRYRDESIAGNLFSERELYFDDGTGFREDRKMREIVDEDGENYHFCFIPQEGSSPNIASIRFDPKREGGVTVTDFALCVIYEDGTESICGVQGIRTNGCVIDEKIVFLKNDPQIIVRLEKTGGIQRVRVRADIFNNIDDADIVRAAKQETIRNNVFYRFGLKVYRKLKRVMKKLIK